MKIIQRRLSKSKWVRSVFLLCQINKIPSDICLMIIFLKVFSKC